VDKRSVSRNELKDSFKKEIGSVLAQDYSAKILTYFVIYKVKALVFLICPANYELFKYVAANKKNPLRLEKTEG
jgi:hypothetical protein